MKQQKGFTIVEVVFLLVFVLFLAGWGQSIYKLTQCDFEAPYKAEFFYSAGSVIPPLGGIVGWLNIDD